MQGLYEKKVMRFRQHLVQVATTPPVSLAIDPSHPTYSYLTHQVRVRLTDFGDSCVLTASPTCNLAFPTPGNPCHLCSLTMFQLRAFAAYSLNSIIASTNYIEPSVVDANIGDDAHQHF